VVRAENIVHSYLFEGSARRSLNGLSLNIEKGQFVALLGHNGCGKSTFARHLNALTELQSGSLTVCGIDVTDKSRRHELRRRCGMVFQNPDNQFVSSLVEEDIAFGLRNFGYAEAEIPGRIAAALSAVGLSGFEKRSPQLLSGGQKQRLAIAGVLAFEPELVVLDEVTAMLDPEGRQEVLSAAHELHRQGRTVILISHYVEEAVEADMVVLMHDGEILAQGSPRDMLCDRELMVRTGLTPPLAVRLYYDIFGQDAPKERCPLSLDSLTDIIRTRF